MIIPKLIELRDRVRQATARVGKAEGRPVPLFWSRQFSWVYPGKPEEKFATMGNYAAGEVRIHALGAIVQYGATATDLTKALQRTDQGYANALSRFDFEWNLQYNSSGAQYGVAGHTDVAPFLSSEVFRGEMVGERFEVSPIRLGLNESIEIRVRPTNWFFESITLVITFQLWGTRSYV